MQELAGLEVTDPPPSEVWEQTPARLNVAGNATPVDSWRTPRTTTTATWRDGTMAPAFVTVADSLMSEAMVGELNYELAGCIHIERTGRESHMWNGKTGIAFFRFLTRVLRMRRTALGLTAQDRAMVLCGKCSSHQSKAYKENRIIWAQEMIVEIIGDDDESGVEIPGGMGACGAPNDSWHQFVHLLRKAYLRVAIDWHASVLLRRALHELNIGADGGHSVTCKLRQSVNADAYALRTLATYGNGRILRHAWLRTGLATPELMAKWHNYKNAASFAEDPPHKNTVVDIYSKYASAIAHIWHINTFVDILSGVCFYYLYTTAAGHETSQLADEKIVAPGQAARARPFRLQAVLGGKRITAAWREGTRLVAVRW